MRIVTKLHLNWLFTPNRIEAKYLCKSQKEKKKINEKEDKQDFLFELYIFSTAVFHAEQNRKKIKISFKKLNKIFFELDIITLVAMTLTALIALLYSCDGKGF